MKAPTIPGNLQSSPVFFTYSISAAELGSGEPTESGAGDGTEAGTGASTIELANLKIANFRVRLDGANHRRFI